MLEQPRLLEVSKGEYVLEEEYLYDWQKGYWIFQLAVPKFFGTDIASIPKRLRWTGFRADGLHRAAAILHDFLYYHKGKVPNTGVGGFYRLGKVLDKEGFTFTEDNFTDSITTWSRKQVDELFLKVMKEAGVKWYKRKTMYWAVRMFGQSHWDS